jgi:hypothetical protein
VTTEIVLMYRDTVLTNLAYNADEANQTEFMTIDAKEPVLERVYVEGRTLRGRGYQSIKHEYYKHKVVISANELDYTNYTFIKAWWNAKYKYIAYRTGNSFGNYHEVMLDDTSLPVQYIDNLINFKEITLSLTNVNAE